MTWDDLLPLHWLLRYAPQRLADIAMKHRHQCYPSVAAHVIGSGSCSLKYCDLLDFWFELGQMFISFWMVLFRFPIT